MDWVEARIHCSLDYAWMILREQIKIDLNRWKELEPNPSIPVEANFGDSLVTVSKRSPMGEAKHWVRISKCENDIRLKTPAWAGAHEITLVPMLNRKGECRLLNQSEELEFWQASRLALEPVLF
jgi:hypothetical protein